MFVDKVISLAQKVVSTIVAGIILAIYRFFPRMKKLVWLVVYDIISWYGSDMKDVVFLNYGYADPDGEIELKPEDVPDRTCIQLYNHVCTSLITPDEWKGADVLEVGCGRGGGSSFIARYFPVESMTGLDLSPKSIEFCSKKHADIPNLSFTVGSADEIPLPDSSCDAVVNVESSHCYPSFTSFVGEVVRVLRPGGRFFFADFRSTSPPPHLKEAIEAAGLKIEVSEDITPQVVEGMMIEDKRKKQMISSRIPRIFQPIFEIFAGTSGTAISESLRNGRSKYLHYVAKK